MFGSSSSCMLALGSPRLTQYSYVSFVPIERSVWMIALTGIVVVCVAVVEVTFTTGGVFLLDPSVESVNLIFDKVAGFRFMFSLASLTASGFGFDCLLGGFYAKADQIGSLLCLSPLAICFSLILLVDFVLLFVLLV